MELSRILTGKKKLNTKTAEKISENLKLLETEKKIFETDADPRKCEV